MIHVWNAQIKEFHLYGERSKLFKQLVTDKWIKFVQLSVNKLRQLITFFFLTSFCVFPTEVIFLSWLTFCIVYLTLRWPVGVQVQRFNSCWFLFWLFQMWFVALWLSALWWFSPANEQRTNIWTINCELCAVFCIDVDVKIWVKGRLDAVLMSQVFRCYCSVWVVWSLTRGDRWILLT